MPKRTSVVDNRLDEEQFWHLPSRHPGTAHNRNLPNNNRGRGSKYSTRELILEYWRASSGRLRERTRALRRIRSTGRITHRIYCRTRGAKAQQKMGGTEAIVVDFQEFQKEYEGNITSEGGSLEFLTEVILLGSDAVASNLGEFLCRLGVHTYHLVVCLQKAVLDLKAKEEIQYCTWTLPNMK